MMLRDEKLSCLQLPIMMYFTVYLVINYTDLYLFWWLR